MSYRNLGYFIVGWLSLVLGVIGIILPLLPTTPFVLLAAFCFSKSSVRFHMWLLNHKLFGAMVLDWEKHGVIKLQAKWMATIGMVLMVSFSMFLVAPSFLVVFSILVMVLAVLIFIWTRPSSSKDN